MVDANVQLFFLLHKLNFGIPTVVRVFFAVVIVVFAGNLGNEKIKSC